MSQILSKKIFNTFFFGNFFAGFCAVALCIETNFQHGLALNGVQFYAFIFLATAYYYTFSYTKGTPDHVLNERVIWYKKNELILKKSQAFILILILIDLLLFIVKYHQSIFHLNSIKFGQITIFPLIALAYTFNLLPFSDVKKLRTVGWLKPFAIGFVWSGIVSVYPIIFYQIQLGSHANFFSLPSGLLWLKNFMFVSTLCIMFDLKDYDHDKQEGLKTYAVQLGIIKTISFIIIPLVCLGIITFLKFHASIASNNTPSILLNLLPYLLLLISAYSLRKHKSIIYYLSVIDGLMIVKAVCGIVGAYITNK
jgi:4-hydroxybenzoate polyprenyltransferase